MKNKILKVIAVLAAGGLMQACSTVSAEEKSITIEHTWRQVGFAQLKADKHCGQFGKAALLVQQGPRRSSTLALEMRESVFHCVKPEQTVK